MSSRSGESSRSANCTFPFIDVTLPSFLPSFLPAVAILQSANFGKGLGLSTTGVATYLGVWWDPCVVKPLPHMKVTLQYGKS